jgi:hypothetical protein
LAFQPFASAHQISRMISLWKLIVCRHLTESLGFMRFAESIHTRDITNEARYQRNQS